MTDNDNRPPVTSDSPPATATDPKKTFDMYHIFSRWDLILLVGVILALLVVVLFLSFSGGSAGAVG